MAASASSPVKFKRTLSRRMDVAADAADDDLDAVVAPGAVYRLDDGAKGGAGGPRTSGVGGKAAAATRLSGGGGGSHTDGDEEPARPEPLPPRRRKGDRGRGKGWGCDEVFDPRGAIIAVDFHVAQQRVIRLNEVNSSCSVRHLKYLLDQARDNTRHFFHPGRLKLFSPEGREMTDNERAIGAYGIMDDEVMVTVEEVKHPHPGYCILEGATLDVLCPTGPPVRDQKAADLEARILKEEASSTDSDEEVAAMVAAERAKRAKQPPPRVVRSYRDVPWAVELVDDLLLFETQLRRAGGRPLGKQVPGGTEPRALRTCVARLAAEMAQLASLDRIPCNAELWVDTDKWHDHQTGLTLGARLEAPPGHYEGQVHWLQIRIPERYPYVPYWAQFKSEVRVAAARQPARGAFHG